MRRALQYAGAAVAIAIIWMLVPSSSTSEIVYTSGDSAGFRGTLIAYATEHSPEEAYEAFKIGNERTTNESEQHFAAHIMGDVLYQTAGVDGVTICDETFGFGCFHGFFSTAVAGEGADAIKELDGACVERYGPLGTGCQHGIGHGALEFSGHDNVTKALELCDHTTQIEPLLGCTSGVFMEYNTPMTIDERGVIFSPRELHEDDPYGACMDIPEKYRLSCYYELGYWWTSMRRSDTKMLGRWCSMIVEPEYSDVCFLGVGNNALTPIGADSVEKGVVVCERVEDPRGEALCRAGIGWALYATPGYEDIAHEICDGLDEYHKNICLGWYQIDADAQTILNN